ncbi:hypothetical protein G9A89_017714 [Geosiphon pyriformis]|nr:hypothetical protein G9A89_017714 [Geosiphon pyriformis]
MLRKAISNKQFLYLVSAVLHPIVAYRTQFSFVSLNVCMKWDTMICKSLKSKSSLPFDFPNDAIHHPSLYDLKSFEQIQAKSKSVSVVSFANSVGILGCLFAHRLHDLQVFSWCSCHPLLYSFCININPLDNFLAGIVWIFLGCDLFLGGLVTNAFCFQNRTSMSDILGEPTFHKCVSLLRHYGIVFWKRLDLQDPIPHWFDVSVYFLNDFGPSSVRNLLLSEVGLSSAFKSCEFEVVRSHLLEVDSDHLSLFTDDSLSGLGTLGMKAGAVVFFEDINLSLGVGVFGLVSSIMTELQAIALALECVSPSHSINLFSDSQTALDACKSESRLIHPDFRNQCWIEHHHIANVIRYSGVLGNEQADAFTGAAALSNVQLSYMINEYFLRAGGAAVSSNAKHFVHGVFQSVGFGSQVLVDNLYFAVGFTSAHTAGLQMYFMKTLHHGLPVAVHKCLYNRSYLSWYHESVAVFKDSKVAAWNIMAFMHEFCLVFCNNIWLVHAKHQAVMEKSDMIPCDGSVPVLVFGLPLVLSASVVKLLGIADVFGAIVGLNIVIIKKVVKESGSEENIDGKEVPTKMPSGHLWSSETSNTTEFKSIDIKEECLVKKPALTMMPKEPSVKTKKALDKSLKKIDFSSRNNNNDVFLNALLELPPPLKNLITVSVRKFFALDIGLDKVVGKFSQEKLMVIRKLFSKVNGFRQAFTFSKFSEIIHASFTSKSSLAQATEKARAANILVNTNFKKSTSYSDWTVVLKKIPVGMSAEAVHAVLSEFGLIKLIKMQLSILIRKNVICVAKSDKTCVIDQHPIFYVQTRCATVCFDSVKSLDVVIETMSVLKGTNLHWSHLVLAKCTGCEKLGHTSLACSVSRKRNITSGTLLQKILSDSDKSRLAAIYVKCSAPVACSVSFGGPTLLVFLELNNRFVILECSLVSLAEHVDKLAKRLDTSEPIVFQLSPGCQPLVTPLLQNQGADIVISESLGVVTSSETMAGVVAFDFLVVSKMKKTLNNLLIMVISLSAKIDNIGLRYDQFCKTRGHCVLAFGNKFEGVRIFTSGLVEGFFGVGMAIVMNSLLAQHVSKIEEVPGQVVSIYLLFKNRLLITFLGLYAGVLAKARFAQAFNVNLLISKAINTSLFMVLGGNFNKNGTKKCASFKKCSDLDLINALDGSSLRAKRVINYIFINKSLASAVVGHEVILVSNYFNTNHDMVGILVGLEGLVDACLNSAYKQTNKNQWKFKIKNTNTAKVDLNKMWEVLRGTICNLANEVFSKHWFCEFDCSKNKQSLKFFKLESLVTKIMKCLSSGHMLEFDCLVQIWSTHDDAEASKFFGVFQSGLKINELFGHLSTLARNGHIKNIIDKCMESFSLNKGGIIKIVLNYLVIGNKLILESKEIRSKVDEIMVDWTCKRKVSPILPSLWAYQYAPLEHIDNTAFSEVMNNISLSELSLVVSELPNDKATGLFGIPNELADNVPFFWKKTWVSMIPKSYDWDEILTNTRPIVLIETVKKILSKILSDCILFVCSKFGILCDDNFSVLRGTSTQSPIFTIGSVDMQKAYDSVSWHHLKSSLEHIKMCGKFIKFFGKIYMNRVNKIMTNYDLLDRYVKQLCDYRINSNFVMKSGRVESSDSKSSFFVKNGQALTQYILNIVSDYLCAHEYLHEVWTKKLTIYTDGSLSGLDTGDVAYGVAAFFSKIGLGVGIRV